MARGSAGVCSADLFFPAFLVAAYYANCANCAAVKAAGAAPIYAGQPGYSTSLDRDRDGVACES